MSERKINGSVEFHSFDDDPDIGSQIDSWLREYPDIDIVDAKYEVVSYIENNVMKFATFALVFINEPEGSSAPEVNRAMTQKMQLPPNAKGKRWRE